MKGGGGRPRPLNRLQSSLKLPESYNAMLSSSNLRKARGQRCQQPHQPNETCSALGEEADAGQKKQRREHHEVNWELELTNLSKALVRETSFNLSSSSSVSTLSREEYRPITEQQEMLLDFCLEVRDDCKALVLEGSRLARLLTGMHVLCEELSEPQLEVEAIQCTECVMQRARDLVHVVLLNYTRLPHLREWPEHKPLVADLLTTMAQCVDCIRSLLNISGMFAYTKVALPASIFAPILASASAPTPTEVEHTPASSSTPSFSFVVEEPERTQLFLEEFKARDKYRISKKIKEFCAAFSSLSTAVDKLQNVSFFECTIEGEEDDEDEETKSGSSIQTTNGEEGSESESGTDLSQSGSDIMVYVTDENGNKVMKKKEKDEEEQLNKLSGSLVSAFERKMESIQQEQEARQQSLKQVLSARQQQRKRNGQAEAEERNEDEEDEEEEEKEAEEEKKAKKKAQIERQIMEDIKASKKKEQVEHEAGKDDAKQQKKEESVVQKKNQLNKTRGKKKENTASQTKKKKKAKAGEEDAKSTVPPLSLNSNKNHKSSSIPSTPTSSSSFTPLHSSCTSTSPSPSSSSSSALRSSSPPASLCNSHDGAENEGEAKDKKRRNSLFSQAALSLPSIRRSKTKQRIQDDRKGSSLGAVELAMMAFTSPNGQQVSSALLLSPTSPSVASSSPSPRPKSPRSSTSILFSNSFLASEGNNVKERKARERDEKTKNWRRMSLEPTNKRQQQKKKDKKEEKRKEEEEREKLRRWLQSIDPSFIGYADNFLAEKIYLADVILLEENDLKELLLPLGVRRKVYLKVKEEKKKKMNNNNSDDDNNSSSEERSQGQGMKSKERRKKKKSHSDRKRSSAKQGMREDFASMCAIKVEDLMVEKKLGNGAFGDVLKAVWRQTTTVAVKRMRSDLLMDENHRKDFINEMRVMMSMPRHPNIVGMLGGCMSNKGKELLLVMEYVSDGGVREYLQQHPTDVGNLQLLQLAMGIAAGMDHLEANNVIHRDLSLRNILLEIRGTQREYIAKVSDFGLAKKTLSDRRRTLMEESQRGTLIGGPVRRIPLRWTAPEAIESNKFTFKSDVWSFGIVLWELYSFGDTPFSALGVGSNTLDTEALLRHLKEGYRMPRPEECPEEVYKLMTDCWSLLPQFRPTFKDICLKLQAIWKRTLEQQKLLLNHRHHQAPSPTPTIPVVVVGSNHLSTATPSPFTASNNEDAKQKQDVVAVFPSSSSSCDDEIYIE